jgi:CheY-like chemotaxis protein
VIGMILSSMVVSRDFQEVSVLECILGSLHVDVCVETEPYRALARFLKTKIDALIVDCDLPGSSELLRELQSTEMRARTVPLVIMGAAASGDALQETGALFAFQKPISVDQAVHTLSAARNTILEGHLRYHRAGVEIPVSLECESQKSIDAELINLSQGGMLIRTRDSFADAAGLQVSFALPGAGSNLKAKAEVVWRDQHGYHGIRFVKVAEPEQRTLQLWLEQDFLTN